MHPNFLTADSTCLALIELNKTKCSECIFFRLASVYHNTCHFTDKSKKNKDNKPRPYRFLFDVCDIQYSYLPNYFLIYYKSG